MIAAATLPLHAAGVWPDIGRGAGLLSAVLSSVILPPFGAGLMSYFYLETRQATT